MKIIIAIDIRVNRKYFEEEIEKTNTISLTYYESSTSHSKYFVETKYLTDLVLIGKIIQAFENLIP